MTIASHALGELVGANGMTTGRRAARRSEPYEFEDMPRRYAALFPLADSLAATETERLRDSGSAANDVDGAIGRLQRFFGEFDCFHTPMLNQLLVGCKQYHQPFLGFSYGFDKATIAPHV